MPISRKYLTSESTRTAEWSAWSMMSITYMWSLIHNDNNNDTHRHTQHFDMVQLIILQDQVAHWRQFRGNIELSLSCENYVHPVTFFRTTYLYELQLHYSAHNLFKKYARTTTNEYYQGDLFNKKNHDIYHIAITIV